MARTVADFLKMKQEGKKISMITCYDYTTAKLLEAAGVDAILVGDSLGCVMMGYPDTISVTMEDMIHHGKCVTRGCTNTLVVVDMPFMSYQVSVAEAVRNAGRLMQECHCNAVKLEGGKPMVPQIRAMVDIGIPVHAHLGMTPQSVNALGGFKVQGKGEDAARRLIEDCRAVEEAGAFAIVLECVPPKLAALISRKLTIPTIGIGAGAGCDGQVLVVQDMLGMFSDFVPKFVKQFGQVGTSIKDACRAYVDEVKAGTFPAREHSFVKSDCSDEVLERLERE